MRYDLACPFCKHSPIYEEESRDDAFYDFYCHNCDSGFDFPLALEEE